MHTVTVSGIALPRTGFAATRSDFVFFAKSRFGRERACLRPKMHFAEENNHLAKVTANHVSYYFLVMQVQ